MGRFKEELFIYWFIIKLWRLLKIIVDYRVYIYKWWWVNGLGKWLKKYIKKYIYRWFFLYEFIELLVCKVVELS